MEAQVNNKGVGKKRGRPLSRNAGLFVERLLEGPVTYAELRELAGFGPGDSYKARIRTRRILKGSVTKFCRAEYGLNPCCYLDEDKVWRVHLLNGDNPIGSRKSFNWKTTVVTRVVRSYRDYVGHTGGLPLIERQRLLIGLASTFNSTIGGLLSEGDERGAR